MMLEVEKGKRKMFFRKPTKRPFMEPKACIELADAQVSQLEQEHGKLDPVRRKLLAVQLMLKSVQEHLFEMIVTNNHSDKFVLDFNGFVGAFNRFLKDYYETVAAGGNGAQFEPQYNEYMKTFVQSLLLYHRWSTSK